MKSFLFFFVAFGVAVLVAPQDLGLLPYDPFQDDPIEPQLGQLTEFEQDDAESLPQQQQQQQPEQQEQEQDQEQPQQEEQQLQEQQSDDDDEFDAFREEPQFEQLQNAPLQEPQLEQLNVNRQATSEPQLQQLKKKDDFKKKKSTSLGAVGLGGSSTPVDLKYEKKIIIKAHPKFKYQYQVHDKKTKDIKSKEEERDGHKLKGEYKLLQPDHLWRHVKYSSDKKQGWIAQVTYSKG